MAKVLVTGASGFVGKQLILALLTQGHQIYALCRIKGSTLFAEDHPNLFLIFGDLRNPETKKAIPEDIESAYYLVHSMSEITGNLSETEKNVVAEFIGSVRHTHIKQIIYLGGIINDETALSPHLKSRLIVEKILKESGIPVTVLRASIIIGAGSASFEIIRDLCEKLPLMIAPKWVKTACQPIAIVDVLFYLSNVLLNEKCFNKTFDIGGPEVLTFKELCLEYSKFRKLKTWIIDVPVLTPRLSSYWLVFVTSVRFSLCYYLVESMKSSTVVKLDAIKKIIPHVCLSYAQALESAFQIISQNAVVSTWMDSWEILDQDPNINDFIDVPVEGCFKDERKIEIKDSRALTIGRIWRIGGHHGYHALNWAWTLRGLFDRMIGGIGLNRGRRHPTEIQVGDSIDFWRVLLADKEKGRLILFSTMKVPGEAWLEFQIDNDTLVQTATFRPRGIFGRLYWYFLFPFHYLIFQKMGEALAGQKS